MKVSFLLSVLVILTFYAKTDAADFDAAIKGMEKRYAAAETAAGSFKQTYRAPGIKQEESGVFKLKRPGLMRWEYKTPEEKLFVADGKDCFLYVPIDRQATVYPLTPADLARTPFSFLLGGGNILRDYSASAETTFEPAFSGTILTRLAPAHSNGEYEFVTLELDAKTFDIRRVIIREHSGNTQEFFLSDIVLNRKMNDKDFRFKPPRGVEVVRIEE